MKKKWKILFIFYLTLLGTNSILLNKNNYNTYVKKINNFQENFLNENVDYDVSQQSFTKNSDTYSSIKTLYIDTSGDGITTNSLNVSYSKVNNYQWYNASFKMFSVNVLKHSLSKSEFIKNYSSVTLSIDYGINFWDSTKNGWKDSAGKNILTSNRKTLNANISNNGEYNMVSLHDSTRKGYGEIFMYWNWSGNNLIFYVKLKSSVYWTSGSAHHHAAIVRVDWDKVTFNSNFKISNIEPKIKNSILPTFNFDSDTSSKLNFDEKNIYTPYSNRELIEAEVVRRLKNAFGNEYNSWFGVSGFFGINLSYESSFVKVTFSLKKTNSIIKSSPSSYSMPTNIRLTEIYWANTLNKRISITPGKIVNPLSPNSDLIIDNPSFDLKTNTFTYHNSLTINFVAENPNQILYINGNEVPVYNNKYSVSLKDNSKNGDGSSYKVKATNLSGDNGSLKNVELNININSTTTKLGFRWQGWNPNLDEEQYNLVNEKDKNGNPSKTYDPTINKETGMRNIFIFFDDRNYKYPFFQDPLDKKGRFLEENEEFLEENYLRGFIAEAEVANSGVTLIDDIDKSNVNKIEKIRLNENTLEEDENTRINVTDTLKKGKQYSEEGLYHYIIYMNDFVAEKVSPDQQPSKNILATSGSTLHKVIYVNNQQEAYKSFEELDFIKKASQSKVKEFFDSIPGKHLKNYLIKDQSFNSNMIYEMKYEEIIKYWKMYVSQTKTGDVSIEGNNKIITDVSELLIDTLKMNVLNSEEAKIKIKNYILERFKNEYKDLKIEYKEDFVITDLEGKELNDVNLDDFVKLSESQPIKNIDLYIKVNSKSVKIESENNIMFKVVNNVNYDENRVINLSNLGDWHLSYNFTNSNDQVKHNFIENYILNYSNEIIEINNENLDKPWKDETGGQIKFKDDYYLKIKLNNKEYIIKNLEFDLSEEFIYEISKFLNSTNNTKIIINIISTDESIRLTGSNYFTIENDPSSENIAPEKPEPPTKPDQSIEDGDSGSNDSNSNVSSEFVKKNLWWIITVVLISVPAFGIPVWMKMRKRKTKIK